MLDTLLPTIIFSIASQSNIVAEHSSSATMPDELGTSLLVYFLIIVVYGFYWIKQRT
ncbi:MAG: hypothetical protein ACU836_04685 [Gammaproteobacteria bacterium]